MNGRIYPRLLETRDQAFITMDPALVKYLELEGRFPTCVWKEGTSQAVARDDLTVSPNNTFP